MLPNDLSADAAQAFRIHAQEGGNVLHGYMMQYFGVFLHELQVALFGIECGQFSGALFIIRQGLLKYENAEIFESRTPGYEQIQPIFGYPQ